MITEDNTTELNEANAGDTQVLEQSNPLEMSDDDFLKQAPPSNFNTETVKDKEDDSDDNNAVGEESGDSPDSNAVNVDNKPVTTANKEVTANTDTDVTKAAETSTEVITDYKVAYERLMAPFKANGRDIQARSVEDAIALMQMGANYNKKMVGMKPNMKILKILENNDLLSEDKISFLIDLSRKDPSAINKLVKDSGLNPMDLEPEKADEYQPKSHKVDDREMALDEVLDDIKESTGYSQTLNIARDWDENSKKVIGDQPAILKVINDHVERGLYPLIKAEIERERTFGRLSGLSDIEAYRKVGDSIHARGGFNHLASSDGMNQGKTNDAGKVVTPKPKKVEDESRNDARRAMASPRLAAPTGTNPKEYNPLALSDDEFLKQATPKFR